MTRIALSIAGSDPSGGAGIQADLKTFHRFGVYGEAVITLITAQNSRGVTAVQVLDPGLIEQQIAAVLEDLPPHAAKLGALGNRAAVKAVARAISDCKFPLVVDPVMISKHGAPLMEGDARSLFADLLIPCAFLLTPNLQETQELAGMRVADLDSMRRAAEILAGRGAANVLVKGGHLKGEAVDILYTPGTGFRELRAPRINTLHTHGTGCTYSAAITAGLAHQESLDDAVRHAKEWLTRAISSNPGLGSGSGPLNHFA
jgi:hydroxymethylpyrimidine/phosphomethylpyrimidine kinase